MMNKNEFNGILSEKIGYDNENKKFLIRVYPALLGLMENSPKESKSWVNVIRYMFLLEGKDMSKVNVNISSYYSSVKRCFSKYSVILSI